MVTYYDILGVSQNATLVEIKRAFKEKALQYHPDRNPNDLECEEIFKEVNTAYQTLSNSYSRSNYDMLLRYGNRPQASYHTSPPPMYGYRQRPPVFRRKVTSGENLRATLYAFLFAFMVAAVVKSAIYFVEKNRAEERAELLSSRREIFKEVVEKKDQGNLQGSLDLIETMGRFYMEELDMRDFKDQLVYDIQDRADQHLENGEYQEAIKYYDILSEYSIGSTINYMLKLAKAHQGIGDYKRTLEIYQVLRMYGYRNPGFYYDLAHLYEVAGNAEQALNYYAQSAQMAATEYEVTIGKAYPIVISAKMIPKEHYHIYLKVSEMHLKLGQYEQAVNSIAWSREIWPDSLKLYEIEARGFQGLEEFQKMRKTIQEAQLIDPDFKL